MHVTVLPLVRAIPNLDLVIDKEAQLNVAAIYLPPKRLQYYFILICIEVQKFKRQSIFYDIIVAVN